MSSPSDLFDLTGRTAVVTGASSGLGVGFARALAAAGADVVVAARRTDRIDALAAELAENGAQALAVTCDVTEAEQVDALIAAACERFGRVDVLVNNAGTAGDGGPTPERLPHALFERTLQVNLFGTWYGCQAAAARMLADGRGGSIINVSSVLGIGGQQNYPAGYQASKAAVINLTRTLAVSWGDRGVRVNALAPGWFPSEMTEGYFALPPFMDSILVQQPTGRVGRADELTGPLLFLASDASSYVSGHTLTVDGGMSASYGASRLPEELRAAFAQIVPDGLGTPIGTPG
ncbi:MAG: glucose 1-dehydrogenase [Thermoleophilia bacterium]|nr:glucose 1-dehydrogenase [Thermoleophilia bacterium]